MQKATAADWILFGFPVLFLGSLGGAVALDRLPGWVAGVYLIASTLTLGVYGWDKRRARLGEWRIAESTLHTMEMLGGWPGALMGQRLLRHKNRKVSYQIVFWLIVLAHVGMGVWLFSPGGDAFLNVLPIHPRRLNLP